MDIETRLAKVEVEVETNKAAIEKLSRTVEELRASNERGFAEVRREASTHFRWLLGIFMTGFATLLGLMGRIAGLY